MGKVILRGLVFVMMVGVFMVLVVFVEGEFFGNVVLIFDYVWCGFFQNDENFVIQGGFDYVNGFFYVGIWVLIVDFGGVNMEFDFYGGFVGEIEEGIFWDVGVIGYIYLDIDDLDFFEVYGGFGYLFDVFNIGGYVYYDLDNEIVYVDVLVGFSVIENFLIDVIVGKYFDGFDEYVNFLIGGMFSIEYVDFDFCVWGMDVDGDVFVEECIVLIVSCFLQVIL